MKTTIITNVLEFLYQWFLLQKYCLSFIAVFKNKQQPHVGSNLEKETQPLLLWMLNWIPRPTWEKPAIVFYFQKSFMLQVYKNNDFV